MPVEHEEGSDAGGAVSAQPPVVPQIEDDQAVPPRPEERIADVGRAEPDVDHRTSSPEEPSV